MFIVNRAIWCLIIITHQFSFSLTASIDTGADELIFAHVVCTLLEIYSIYQIELHFKCKGQIYIRSTGTVIGPYFVLTKMIPIRMQAIGLKDSVL